MIILNMRSRSEVTGAAPTLLARSFLPRSWGISHFAFGGGAHFCLGATLLFYGSAVKLRWLASEAAPRLEGAIPVHAGLSTYIGQLLDTPPTPGI
jgi:hypothetical protein